MNVRYIGMSRFASHANTDIELPERGLVVVQGRNGAGKSSLIEAVAAAYWSKSLRSNGLWKNGEPSTAIVDSDLARASRTRSAKGKLAVEWEARDAADLAAMRLREEPLSSEGYENNSKAQDRLEQIVGDFEVWKRTSVLSSSDAAHFALATDAERKLLLEQVLGLSRFDSAHAACRADLRAASAERQALERDVEVARARLDGARLASEQAEAALRDAEQPDDEAALTDKLGRVRKAEGEAKQLVRDVRLRRQRIETKRAEGMAEARAARREADAIRARLAEKTCTKCGQSVAHMHAGAEKELADAEARANFEEPIEEMHNLGAEEEELADEHQTLVRKAEELAQRLLTNQQRRDARARAEKQAAQATEQLEKWSQAHMDAVGALAAQRGNVEELEACEKVLGMRGVRATMLDRALVAVQVQANAWLRRLAFPGSIKLSSTTEQKSGKVVDAISLEVVGDEEKPDLGGGKYRGSSGGERRRIDVAMLLGLAEVASASRGGRKGTLFADELFDALDDEGVQAAAHALGDLSRDRCVVVITHNEELASRLPAARRLRVEAGAVVEG